MKTKNNTNQRALDLGHELVVDLFAGGGGTSLGLEWGLGRSPDIAVNHDPEAVAMHLANHPNTRHFCESVFTVDPVKVTNNQPVGLLWASPDCKHFSKAKGGRPVSKKIRGLAWVVVRWARAVRPRVIMLENVEEFQDWGPIGADGKPCPKRKGQTFRQFLEALQRQGYKVEHRELRACDYGAPTIRKRLFLIARRDGLPIAWPKPTHGHPDSPAVKRGKLKPWRTAAECIDWSIPCPSIFERKRPLAENTMRRIAKGVQRFVIDAQKPFIVTCNHSGEGFRGQDLGEPMKTLTGARDAHGLVAPYFVPRHGERDGQDPRTRSVEEPMPTVTATANGASLVTPYMTRIGQTGGRGAYVNDAREPLTTVTSKAEHLVVAPHITKFRTGSVGNNIDEPLRTITTAHSEHHPGGAAPLGVVAAFMAQHNNTCSDSRRVDVPLSTITSTGSQQALVASNLVKLYGTCQDGRDVREPMPTITAGGNHVGEVRAFLTKYYGTGFGQDVRDPIGTVTSRDHFGLVTVNGEAYEIADIGMRMLEPRELYRAQGFPDSYLIEIEVDGRRLPKSSQVRMCGNSVSPYVSAAIARANFAHERQLQQEVA